MLCVIRWNLMILVMFFSSLKRTGIRKKEWNAHLFFLSSKMEFHLPRLLTNLKGYSCCCGSCSNLSFSVVRYIRLNQGLLLKGTDEAGKWKYLFLTLNFCIVKLHSRQGVKILYKNLLCSPTIPLRNPLTAFVSWGLYEVIRINFLLLVKHVILWKLFMPAIW